MPPRCDFIGRHQAERIAGDKTPFLFGCEIGPSTIMPGNKYMQGPYCFSINLIRFPPSLVRKGKKKLVLIALYRFSGDDNATSYWLGRQGANPIKHFKYEWLMSIGRQSRKKKKTEGRRAISFLWRSGEVYNNRHQLSSADVTFFGIAFCYCSSHLMNKTSRQSAKNIFEGKISSFFIIIIIRNNNNNISPH